MEYGLVENALHSLNEAASYYNDSDVDVQPDKYKFGILLAAHCAELLLKEKLRRIHPAFIYPDVDRYRVEDKNEETIGYKMAIKRVKAIGHVDLGLYENYLIELGDVRNRLQHFKYEINGEYHKQLMCKAFSAIDYLLRDVLEENVEDYGDILTDDNLAILQEDEDRITVRLADIRRDFSEGRYRKVRIEYESGKFFKVLCPVCGHDSLAEAGDQISCRMCNASFDGFGGLFEADQSCITMNHLLRELGRRKDRIETFECPRCEQDAIIHLPDGAWLCLACGNRYEDTTLCDECGSEMPNSEYFYYLMMSDEDASDYNLNFSNNIGSQNTYLTHNSCQKCEKRRIIRIVQLFLPNINDL